MFNELNNYKNFRREYLEKIDDCLVKINGFYEVIKRSQIVSIKIFLNERKKKGRTKV